MKRKILVIVGFLILISVVAFVDPYARRIRPFTSVPASCAENEIGYSMTLHNLYICKNTGYIPLIATATPVTSVFGRTGAVVAASNDYTFAQLASIPTTFAGYGISDTSANFFSAITNETGSGLVVGSISPTFTGTVVMPLTTFSVGNTTSTQTDILTNPVAKTSGNLFDAQVNSVSKFKVDFSGIVTSASDINSGGNINIAGSSNLTWGGTFGAGIPTILGVSGGSARLSFYPSGNTNNEQMRLNTTGGLSLGTLTDPGVGNLLVSGSINGSKYATATNCSDSAGAAACGSAAAGNFVIDATTTSTVISTTAITANSQVFVQEDSSLGARLGITCNTQSILVLGPPTITARTAGTSFTVSIVVGPTTNPACYSYHIIN